MLVGKTGSGKTTAWTILQQALGRLHQEAPTNVAFQPVSPSSLLTFSTAGLRMCIAASSMHCTEHLVADKTTSSFACGVSKSCADHQDVPHKALLVSHRQSGKELLASGRGQDHLSDGCCWIIYLMDAAGFEHHQRGCITLRVHSQQR